MVPTNVRNPASDFDRTLRQCVWLFSAAAIVFTATTVSARDDLDPRGLALAEINDTPAFLVRADVDHPNRVYRGGECIQASVRSERQGYLYLLYCDANKQITCLFPNQVQRENFIPANQTILIPDPAAMFRLRVGPPFGNEILKAIVTSEPLRSLELETLTKGDMTWLNSRKLKAVFVEVNGGDTSLDPTLQDTQALRETNRERARQWSEHCVSITTVANGQEVPPPLNLESMPRLEDVIARGSSEGPALTAGGSAPEGRPKRVGVFIGVRSYLDPGIRPLHVADHDAQEFAAAMKQFGQLDESVVLVNERATLRNIQAVIYQSLTAATNSGDVIFIYWSGHGGRTSNLDGTEPDGYDEYLVPYDGRLETADAIRATMLLDKTFGRWVQNLDGRQLIVIIDACHGGGQTQGAIKAITAGDEDTPFRKFFFATTWQRTKDIGQRETAVLASSRATQVSFEQPEGDLSVMTHFLIEKLTISPQPVTLSEAFEYVKEQVPAFVEQHYPGTTQTPVFVDQTTPPVYLRP
jgi:hypothetical protein